MMQKWVLNESISFKVNQIRKKMIQEMIRITKMGSETRQRSTRNESKSSRMELSWKNFISNELKNESELWKRLRRCSEKKLQQKNPIKSVRKLWNKRATTSGIYQKEINPFFPSTHPLVKIPKSDLTYPNE